MIVHWAAYVRECRTAQNEPKMYPCRSYYPWQITCLECIAASGKPTEFFPKQEHS